jgi:hypothetical protein
MPSALRNVVLLITSLLLSLMKECHHVQVHLHNVPRGYRQVLVYLPIALQRQSRKQLVQTPDAETTLPSKNEKASDGVGKLALLGYSLCVHG